MHFFYTPDITPGEYYTLSEDESRHSVKVLRLREKEQVFLTDGRGRLYTAEIAEAHPKHCLLRIVEVREEVDKLPYSLHVAIAPTKNITRFEWFLEKAAEVGVHEITPLITRRSERRNLRIARLEKVITSAVKQSLKAYHPVLHEPLGFTDFLASAGAVGAAHLKFIAHCNQGEKHSLGQVLKPGQPVLALIGPEGDFTPEEVAQALERDFLPLSLGRSRLRTETAGLAVCFETAFVNGD